MDGQTMEVEFALSKDLRGEIDSTSKFTSNFGKHAPRYSLHEPASFILCVALSECRFRYACGFSILLF